MEGSGELAIQASIQAAFPLIGEPMLLMCKDTGQGESSAPLLHRDQRCSVSVSLPETEKSIVHEFEVDKEKWTQDPGTSWSRKGWGN